MFIILDLFRKSTSVGNFCVGSVLKSSCTSMYIPVLRSEPSSNSLTETSFKRGLSHLQKIILCLFLLLIISGCDDGSTCFTSNGQNYNAAQINETNQFGISIPANGGVSTIVQGKTTIKTGQWINSGVSVKDNDQLRISATGTVVLSFPYGITGSATQTLQSGVGDNIEQQSMISSVYTNTGLSNLYQYSTNGGKGTQYAIYAKSGASVPITLDGTLSTPPYIFAPGQQVTIMTAPCSGADEIDGASSTSGSYSTPSKWTWSNGWKYMTAKCKVPTGSLGGNNPASMYPSGTCQAKAHCPQVTLGFIPVNPIVEYECLTDKYTGSYLSVGAAVGTSTGFDTCCGYTVSNGGGSDNQTICRPLTTGSAQASNPSYNCAINCINGNIENCDTTVNPSNDSDFVGFSPPQYINGFGTALDYYNHSQHLCSNNPGCDIYFQNKKSYNLVPGAVATIGNGTSDNCWNTEGFRLYATVWPSATSTSCNVVNGQTICSSSPTNITNPPTCSGGATAENPNGYCVHLQNSSIANGGVTFTAKGGPIYLQIRDPNGSQSAVPDLSNCITAINNNNATITQYEECQANIPTTTDFGGLYQNPAGTNTYNSIYDSAINALITQANTALASVNNPSTAYTNLNNILTALTALQTDFDSISPNNLASNPPANNVAPIPGQLTGVSSQLNTVKNNASTPAANITEINSLNPLITNLSAAATAFNTNSPDVPVVTACPATVTQLPAPGCYTSLTPNSSSVGGAQYIQNGQFDPTTIMATMEDIEAQLANLIQYSSVITTSSTQSTNVAVSGGATVSCPSNLTTCMNSSIKTCSNAYQNCMNKYQYCIGGYSYSPAAYNNCIARNSNYGNSNCSVDTSSSAASCGNTGRCTESFNFSCSNAADSDFTTALTGCNTANVTCMNNAMTTCTGASTTCTSASQNYNHCGYADNICFNNANNICSTTCSAVSNPSPSGASVSNSAMITLQTNLNSLITQITSGISPIITDTNNYINYQNQVNNLDDQNSAISTYIQTAQNQTLGSLIGGYTTYVSSLASTSSDGRYLAAVISTGNPNNDCQPLSPSNLTLTCNSNTTIVSNGTPGNITPQGPPPYSMVNAGGNIWLLVLDPDYDYSNNIGSYAVTINLLSTIPAFDTVFTGVLQKIQTIVTNASKAIFQNITCTGSNITDSCTNYVRIIILMLNLYIIIYGICFMFGVVEINAYELFIRAFKIGIIVTLLSANSWEFFNNYLFEGFLNITSLLVSSATGVHSDDPFLFLNGPIAVLMMDPITYLKIIALIFQGVLGIIVFFILLFGIYSFVEAIFYGFVLYLQSIVGVGICLAIAPIFIPFILFKQTAHLAENWYKSLLRFAVQPAILLVGLVFLSGMLANIITEILNFSACFKCALPVVFGIPGWSDAPPTTLFCIPWFAPWGTDNAGGAGIPFILVTPLPLIISFCMLTKVMSIYSQDLATKITSAIFGGTAMMKSDAGKSSPMGTGGVTGMAYNYGKKAVKLHKDAMQGKENALAEAAAQEMKARPGGSAPIPPASPDEAGKI